MKNHPTDIAEGIRELLNPTSVAVVGASRRLGSIGGAIVANLKRDGFRGPIYPVNPKADEVQGLRAYPTVVSIAAPVDLVVVAVPAPLVEAAVDDAIAAQARGLVIITAGFAEQSDEGRAAEQRLLAKVRQAGVRMVGPNCMGTINTDTAVRLNTTFTPIWPPEGNIAILSQSGALGLTILDQVKALNLGISSFVSVGNKADVSGNDLLTYWAEDPNTDVIVLYLESFGNPRTFARVAPDVVRRKPIVAVKAGRTAAGTRAASSHSAALASLDVAADALFEQAGVIRTNTLEELFDVAALLATQPLPKEPRVGVVTNAGGPGILLADACEARGLTLPSLSSSTIDALRDLLPPHAGLANPIDLVGSDSSELYEETVRLVGSDSNVDAVVVIFIPPLVTTRPESVAAAIARGVGAMPADKPVQSVFLSVRGTPDMLGSGPRGRIPSYSFPENAAIALAAACRYNQWRKRPRGTTLSLPDDAATAIRKIINTPAKKRWLEPAELSEVLRLAGVNVAESAKATPADAEAAAERIGYPVVAKAVAPGLLHKSDVGGVVTNIDSPEALREAIERIRHAVTTAGVTLEHVLIQRYVPGGIEALVGVTLDPVFGPLVVCGMGGVNVELLKDVSFRLTPVSDTDAAAMLDGLRSAPLLDGYRGAPPGDRAALIELIQRISALVEAVPELRELDLNPVKVLPPGQGVVAVDARMRIGPVRSDQGIDGSRDRG